MNPAPNPLPFVAKFISLVRGPLEPETHFSVLHAPIGEFLDFSRCDYIAFRFKTSNVCAYNYEIREEMFQIWSERHVITLGQGLDLNSHEAGTILIVCHNVDSSCVARSWHDVPSMPRQAVAYVEKTYVPDSLISE